MVEIPAVPPIEGVKDFWGVLDLLHNEKKYRKRLTVLEATRDAINENIKAIGSIREIEKLRIQGRTDRDNAATILADAKTKAAGIMKKVDEKHADIDKRQNDLEDRATEVDRIEAGHGKKIALREKAVTTREEIVAALESKVVEAEKAVKTAAALTDEAKRRYDETLADIAVRAAEGARA